MEFPMVDRCIRRYFYGNELDGILYQKLVAIDYKFDDMSLSLSTNIFKDKYFKVDICFIDFDENKISIEDYIAQNLEIRTNYMLKVDSIGFDEGLINESTENNRLLAKALVNFSLDQINKGYPK